ncbi:hypothetical protein GWI33_021939 [Rhynchophorus ferrugineus]|uniref:Gamma-aminobutyric acid type B receptor subunit 2 n=1 Tax=Rhynchophorus ferrugineus TaxID=354439 RepID=A0A834IRC1_RHYFE|nr:hypothetical protein GWI33_021939 [Rhynchophorus ferrugineus]
MLLGSGCSNVTEALAHIVPYWNIVQVSYGSKSPTLSDAKTFPFFFRTVAPDSSHDIAKIHFIKHYKWQVVATFSESENAYLLPVNQLIKELEEENITCIATVTFSIDNYKEQLRFLKALDIRIIIGSFSTKMAPRIFCEIYNLNMHGKEYVWILEKTQNQCWNITSLCSRRKIIKAMEGVVMVEDYYGRYDRKLLKHINVSFSNSALLAYDAIWAMALALKKADVRSPDEFHYQNKDMACQFVSTMRNLEFIGLSGPIKFNGADRVGDLLVSQIQGGKSVDVALYDSIKNTLGFNCKFCHNISWYDGHVPIAQHIFKETLVTIPTTLFFTISGMSMVGILVSFIFLYLNLKFRQMKTVKLSSPNLNNMAVAGCILVYLSIMVFEMHNVEIKWKLYINEFCSVSSAFTI